LNVATVVSDCLFKTRRSLSNEFGDASHHRGRRSSLPAITLAKANFILIPEGLRRLE